MHSEYQASVFFREKSPAKRTEKKKKKERGKRKKCHRSSAGNIYKYMCIYIYIERERERETCKKGARVIRYVDAL